MLPYFAIVKQYQRLAVFWLGKYMGVRSPGLSILVWPLHRTRRIDLRESVINIPKQTSITSDNAPINIDFLVYMRVKEQDAQKSVLEVVDYSSAVIGMATTTLRAVIGEMPLDHVLSQARAACSIRVDSRRYGASHSYAPARMIPVPSTSQPTFLAGSSLRIYIISRGERIASGEPRTSVSQLDACPEFPVQVRKIPVWLKKIPVVREEFL